MANTDPGQALRARLGEDVDDPTLWDAVENLTREAQATHPKIALADEVWAEHLARALRRVEPSSWPTCATELRGADLWLACGLSIGDKHALEQFEHTLMPQVDRALRRFCLGEDERTDLRQRTRIRLLVATPGTPPRISQYTGRGSLAGWVRTTAGRLALNLRRDEPQHAAIDAAPELVMQSTPELARIRRERRSLFSSALTDAFAALARRDRTLLRLRYADEMTAVTLARAYGVHESTMSRWLASARASMVDRFRQIISAQLTDSTELAELMQVMHSQLDASLNTLLATTSPPS
ncbi:MAG: sigma-70 family RNA polymerase sigma factor [Deltaproteobacteria bacterium]|nr:sigma-70 family RNA polymerase sigma factor [Deltaproteobacteria bacterium]